MLNDSHISLELLLLHCVIPSSVDAEQNQNNSLEIHCEPYQRTLHKAKVKKQKWQGLHTSSTQGGASSVESTPTTRSPRCDGKANSCRADKSCQTAPSQASTCLWKNAN
ncbi:hypothetical protein F2P81_013723 [Scophthalmus maximus]|uniref:Secreted protein n=1 Tax=Scophthalmus maximus TaxID=52904 RepID=A0A6A4SKD1_SCOMX|nr:hypothetical protein F2P81_013723 [Scophthalmus maximus]